MDPKEFDKFGTSVAYGCLIAIILIVLIICLAKPDYIWGKLMSLLDNSLGTSTKIIISNWLI